MLRLNDIMTRDVATLHPDQTLREALERLAASHISGAPVIEGGRIVGALSSMDVIDFLATTPSMGRPDQSSEGDESLHDAEDENTTYFIDYWSVTERTREADGSTWDVLAEHTVAEAMSRRLIALPPTADVRAAADAMQRAKAHRILVVDGTKLAGIVSALDIARAVAQHRLQEQRYVYSTRRSHNTP